MKNIGISIDSALSYPAYTWVTRAKRMYKGSEDCYKMGSSSPGVIKELKFKRKITCRCTHTSRSASRFSLRPTSICWANYRVKWMWGESVPLP